ncbi:MAG: serpin family protein [Planctomycetota bacterium]|nr:serpin family protein [Planctomycetota bacterium]
MKSRFKKCRILLWVVLLGCGLVYSVSRGSWEFEEGVAVPDNFVEGNTAFALDLYHELGSPQENLFFSPYSISTALAMTCAGAKGNTAKEMQEVLYLDPKTPSLHRVFGALSREMEADLRKEKQSLAIATGLCLTGDDVSSNFKALLKDRYEAELFDGDLDTINRWVEKKTEGKIEKILEFLDPNSVCVLLSAISFKGVWKSTFEKKNTSEAFFYRSSEKRVRVPIMYQKGKFRFLAKEDFQIVALPYQGEEMSMIVLLPGEMDGWIDLEKRLTSKNLSWWLKELDDGSLRKIDLYLPKFRIEADYLLNSPCQKLGMKEAFDSKKADFGGMGFSRGDAWISKVQHKAFVEVDEEGTAAGAGTAVDVRVKSSVPVFRADHPFLFLIRHNRTGTILFMGRVVDPGNHEARSSLEESSNR